VTVNGGHNVLQKAAEEAVRKAQPLPKPPKEVPCPLQVSYGMEFNLK
jgi:protein TonB